MPHGRRRHPRRNWSRLRQDPAHHPVQATTEVSPVAVWIVPYRSKTTSATASLISALYSEAPLQHLERCLGNGGVDHVNARDGEGWTPLMWAARLGNAEAVCALLGAGADPTYREHNGLTAFGLASTYKHHRAAAALWHAMGER